MWQGRTELELVELGTQQDALIPYVVRPGVVQKKDVGFVTSTLISAGGLMPQIGVDELAAATVNIAMSGTEMEERQVWDNQELVVRGRESLLKAD